MENITNKRTLEAESIQSYLRYLREQERSSQTVQKYAHDLCVSSRSDSYKRFYYCLERAPNSQLCPFVCEHNVSCGQRIFVLYGMD